MVDQNGAALTGGCQCGAVRYRLASQPSQASICHCRMCQKAFGSYIAPLADLPVANVAWTRGKPSLFRSSDIVERGFCRECGTPLTYKVVEQDKIAISIGSLDDPDLVVPTVAFGMQGKRPAFATLDGLPGTRTDEEPDSNVFGNLKSYQHPDHDTAVWPSEDDR